MRSRRLGRNVQVAPDNLSAALGEDDGRLEQSPTVIARSGATKQSMGSASGTDHGLLRCARNDGGEARGFGAQAASGSQTVKVVPLPGSLSTAMRPPWRRTRVWLIDRPRPVPSRRLVVKNGSKIRCRTSGAMP